MIGNWQISDLEHPKQCLELGLANLDASILLCGMMNSKSFPETFHHAKVIMSLAYHGVELFLKYGIGKKKDGNCPDGHFLLVLKNEYIQLYPEPEFQFEVPFINKYIGFTDEQVEEKIKQVKKDKEPPYDQQLRYYRDKNGNQWSGVHGFKPNDYLDHLKELKQTLIGISKKIEAKNKGIDAHE
ncbi:MAG: hypothetical protein JXR23_11305 [Pontiellaceae bacterium]|nr:hypothetical protein [Pontiellaceae bacterium]